MNRTTFATFAAIACLAPSGARAQDAGPSFECAGQLTRSERAICADPMLSEIDRASAEAFRETGYSSRRQALAAAVREHKGQEACIGDAACILERQVDALKAYGTMGAEVTVPSWVPGHRLSLLARRPPRRGPTPNRVGQCTRTAIVEMSGRLGGPVRPTEAEGRDTGMFLRYADGNAQVTYGYDADAAASRVGDQVATCLASIPDGCPAGDGRGRAYAVTNLRTGGHWTMTDSGHMCGGA